MQAKMVDLPSLVHPKFYPYKRGGGGIFFTHTEGRGGGHKVFWGSLNAGPSSLSHTEGGGGGAQKVFHPLKVGHKNVNPILWGWEQFWTCILLVSLTPAKSVHSLKGGRKKLYPVLRGGGDAKSLGPPICPFCSPPSL